MKEILIDRRQGQNHIFILEENKLVEYHIEEDKKELVGNIYRARVENVLKGMNSAFLDIGQGKNAYLHLRDALGREALAEATRPSIDRILKVGDEVLVQVVKDPVKDKGAKVTTHLSLSGRYMVLTPYHLGVNISRKIIEKKEQNRLYRIGKELGENIGLILRTAAEGVDEDLIRQEYEELSSIMSKIERQRNFLPSPKLIYKDLGIVYKSIRDRLEEEISITVNSQEVHQEILEMEDYLNESIKDRLKLDSNFSLDYNSKIQEGVKEALNRKVGLKSGGSIVIDETEALVAIDVNTGKYIGNTSYEETIYQTNLEAAKKIGEQIRLRNLSGIIIIDFIDMKKENLDQVLLVLEEEFKKDKNRANIISRTKLGLVEITRKRISPSLDLLLTEKCPTCQGFGRIRK